MRNYLTQIESPSLFRVQSGCRADDTRCTQCSVWTPLHAYFESVGFPSSETRVKALSKQSACFISLLQSFHNPWGRGFESRRGRLLFKNQVLNLNRISFNESDNYLLINKIQNYFHLVFWNASRIKKIVYA